MIVICEECGKKYRVDPEKIKGERARFKCKACNHLITVSKKEVTPPEATPKEAQESGKGLQPEIHLSSSPAPETEEGKGGVQQKKGTEKRHKTKIPLPSAGGMGLRWKMTLLFFVVPIALMSIAGILYLRDLNRLSEVITGESAKVVTRFAEQSIAEKARSVAAQVGLYLEAHPDLKREVFNMDPAMKALAIQKVGSTGYTALYELPDSEGIWRTWAHVNGKIIGIDMSKLRKPLGKNFPGFWKVYTGVGEGKESKGYYTWQDKDGTFRQKFMVCVPVKGTRYIVAATTYLDEFGKHVRDLENRASLLTMRMRNINFGVLGGTLLLIGLIVSIYGQRLAGKIKALTLLAERISVGEMDAEVDIKSKDEIGALAEAISRMQESIRLSIERLRRRRQKLEI